MAVPMGMRNPRIPSLVTRCGYFDDEMTNDPSFMTYRDIFTDNYNYILPVENKYVPEFVKTTRQTIIPDRPNQNEVEKTICAKFVEERVLVQRLFGEFSKNHNGYIVRSELYSILLKLCPNLKFDQFEKILQKSDLDKLSVYFFETVEKKFKALIFKPIYAAECEAKTSFPNIKATTALYRLRLAAIQETFDFKELLPESCFAPNSILLLPQLREALCRINIRLTDKEFYKLWEKFDKSNIGSIPMEYLFHMLNLQDDGRPMCGIRKMPTLQLREKGFDRLKRPPITDTYRCLNNPTEEDKVIRAGGTSFPLTRIHGWIPQGMGGLNEPEFGKGTRCLAGLNSLLKCNPKYDSILENLYYMFEAPYQAMFIIFSHYDDRNRGKITIEEALRIFLEYGFSITLKDFYLFLKDAGCIFEHSFVKYRQLMEKYQNKPELSYVDRIIKHIIKTQYEDIGLKTLTTMSPMEIEKHFIKLLHGPYMKLMEELQKKADSKFTVPPDTFRETLKKHCFKEDIPQRQWEEFLKSVEIDSSTGNILYKQFLYTFSKPGRKCKPVCPKPAILVSTKKTWDTTRYERAPRDLLILCLKIEKLVKRRFHFIDKYYKYFDKKQVRIFTENQLLELLKNEKSDITKSEVRSVWKIMENHISADCSYQEVMKFIMQELVKTARALKIKERIDSNKGYFDRNIDILKAFKANQKIEKEKEKQYIRHKIDVSLTTNDVAPFDGDVTELIEKIKPTIHQYWEDIKCYFIKLDVIGSTTIENHQMQTFSLKFLPQLSKLELSNLIKKFDINKNGRFHYVEFLKRFRLNVRDDSKNTKFDCYTYKMVDKKSSATYRLAEIREILRYSMIKKWKNLLSAFKKLDVGKTGFLSIEEINKILKENKIFLGSNDLYHILTNFDRNLDLKIDYYEFIREILDINLVNVD